MGRELVFLVLSSVFLIYMDFKILFLYDVMVLSIP